MRLSCGRAWLELDPCGAIIADAVLYVGDKPVRPLFQNPWRDDPRQMDTLTRHLGGEWPCVPFGVPQPPADLPLDWQCESDAETDWHRHAHGYGAHMMWTLKQEDAHTAVAEIIYPADGPIARLRRRICLTSESEIALSLDVEPRRDTRIPIGLHPVISLADAAPNTAQINVAGDETAWTFPLEVEPGRSHLQPDQRAASLAALRGANGALIDARSLPFDAHSEDLVLLTSPGGRVSLSRPEREYRVDVTWDDKDLPSCLLWLSNRGRDYAPWDGRVCAIGIEPVAAAFDLGVNHSTSAETPLAQAGIRSHVALTKGETWRTAYAISVHQE